MSRIGLKPIPKPAGVSYTIKGNTVEVKGPKGTTNALLPTGIKLVEKDNQIVAERENDSQKAIHGLARALVFNAVEGVTNGWKKELPCGAERQGLGCVHAGLFAPNRVSAAHGHRCCH